MLTGESGAPKESGESEGSMRDALQVILFTGMLKKGESYALG